MSRGVLDEYFENWVGITSEIVRAENMKCLQAKVDELFGELDPNGTWAVKDLVDAYPVWVEYTKELLRGGCKTEKLKDEIFQCCMYGTM